MTSLRAIYSGPKYFCPLGEEPLVYVVQRIFNFPFVRKILNFKVPKFYWKICPAEPKFSLCRPDKKYRPFEIKPEFLE